MTDRNLPTGTDALVHLHFVGGEVLAWPCTADEVYDATRELTAGRGARLMFTDRAVIVFPSTLVMLEVTPIEGLRPPARGGRDHSHGQDDHL